MHHENFGLEKIFKNLTNGNQAVNLSPRLNRMSLYDDLYFLEFSQLDNNGQRLFYVDRVVSADFYQTPDDKYLTYSILTVYQNDHINFLDGFGSSISNNLVDSLTNMDHSKLHRSVVKIDLPNFSEVQTFLKNHTENY